MRQSRIAGLSVLLVVVLAFATVPLMAQEATGEPQPTQAPPTQTYTVQPGDNLFRIALRFNTSVQALAVANNIVNVRRIVVGQELVIPSAGQPDPTAAPTTPAEPQTVIVQPGDTLNRIAARYNTTVAALLNANNIPNPNVLFVGQEIVIPGDQPVQQTPEPTSEPGEPVDDDNGQVDDQPQTIDVEMQYGIHAFFEGQDNADVVQRVNELGMSWVKVVVDWRQIEPEQGTMEFATLDDIVDSLDSEGLSILFTVTNAPDWARTSQDENGPPDDLNTFFNFLGTLVDRYSGTVDAYQIWDEPNLRRNWNCQRRMCDTDYLFMLGESHALIKDIDPDARVISAGLAPTRFNDRINAVDDRLYLETLMSRGMDTVVDAIGIHPGGEANPPDAECCEQPPGVESHYESDSFYFLENIEGYRNIIVQSGDGNIPLWVTKFGWGTAEDEVAAPSSPNQPQFSVNYTSLNEQAIYIPRAFEIGQEKGYVGAMFLYNLNGCQITELGGLQELCYPSLLDLDGQPRPAYTAVQAIEKPEPAATDMDTGMDDTPADPTDMPALTTTPDSTGGMDVMSTPTPTETESGSSMEPVPFDEATDTPIPTATPAN